MNEPVFNRTFYIILFTAFVLRLPGIIEGLPAVYNSTEYHLAKSAMDMAARQSLDPLWYIYPAFYTYFLMLLFGILFLAGSLTGFYADKYDFALRFLTNPFEFYIFGRSISVLLSLLTIIILYRIIYKRFSQFAAQFAAAIFSISYYTILFADFISHETLLILFCTIAVLFLILMDSQSKRKDFLAVGFIAGLAIGIKYNAGFLGIAVILTPFFISGLDTKQKIQNTLISLCGLLPGFLLPNPYWLIKPGSFIDGLSEVSYNMHSTVSFEQGINYIWEIATFIGNEWLIGVALIFGFIIFSWREWKRNLPLILFVLLTFLYIGSWTKKGIDYLLPVFPALVIFSTLEMEKILKRIRLQGKYYPAFVLTIIFLPSLLFNIHAAVLRALPDTRSMASQWLIQNVQSGEKIFYDTSHYDLAVFDINRFLIYGAGSVRLPGPVRQRLENLRSHPRNVSFVPVLNLNSDNANSNSTRERKKIFYRKKIEEFVENSVSLLITTDRFYQPVMSAKMQKYPESVRNDISKIKKFYAAIPEFYNEIARFEPHFFCSGPLLKIYRLKSGKK